MNALTTTDRLIVYLDVKSPYAFLAKDLTRDLERDFEIAVDWRPFTLDIPSFLGSAKADDKGRVVEQDRTQSQWNAVRYAYMDTKRYARLKEIKIYGPRKIWDTSLVHIGWLWAAREGRDSLDAYLDLVYERFWMRELDVESFKAIESVLTRLGVKTDGFKEYSEGTGRQLHDQMRSAAVNAGVFGVPTFVVDDELFFGREHLPYIRWILGGRQGQAPDIAYMHFGK